LTVIIGLTYFVDIKMMLLEVTMRYDCDTIRYKLHLKTDGSVSSI